MVSRISPMPNRPITAIRKSKPLSNSVKPKVRRSWPVMLSRPTAASAKPIIIDAMVLNGGSLPMPMKEQNGEEEHGEFFRRPELQRELRDQRRDQRDHDHGEQRADERRRERGGQRLAGLPFCAIGWPSKVVATDHGSPGMLNRIEVIAPPNSAPQ